jgi:hypothetical protein
MLYSVSVFGANAVVAANLWEYYADQFFRIRIGLRKSSKNITACKINHFNPLYGPQCALNTSLFFEIQSLADDFRKLSIVT